MKENKAKSRWQQLKQNRDQFELLKFRSDFLHTVREFFWDQEFMEIDAPSLVPAAGMEPHIEPFTTQFVLKNGETHRYYLHTSPEFAMKKMLVAGYEKIFYLGHTFRNEELAPLHSPEFTMLEWYRAGCDYSDLIRDCENLVSFLEHKLQKKWSDFWRSDGLFSKTWEIRTLADIMQEYCQFDLRDIDREDADQLLKIVRAKGITHADKNWSLDDLFFILFLQFVEPHLGRKAPTIIKDYPIWMASLARRKKDDPNFVERFELYVDGYELANAFSELTDADEQYQRLQDEQKLRRKYNRTEIPIDMDFIAALKEGMPPSAGIAMGIDRLMMVCVNRDEIWDVIPYKF